MSSQFSYTDPDGYTAGFAVESGGAVLVSRSDSGTEVSVYLSLDAAHDLSAALSAWSDTVTHSGRGSSSLFTHTDADGYTAEFVLEDGRGVLVSRSDSGTEVSVYLTKDASHDLAAALAAWTKW